MRHWIQLFKDENNNIVLYNDKTNNIKYLNYNPGKQSGSTLLMISFLVMGLMNILNHAKVNIWIVIVGYYILSPLIAIIFIKCSEFFHERDFNYIKEQPLDLFILRDKYMKYIDQTSNVSYWIIIGEIICFIISFITLKKGEMGYIILMFFALCIVWYMIFSLNLIKRLKVVRKLKKQIQKMESSR